MADPSYINRDETEPEHRKPGGHPPESSLRPEAAGSEHPRPDYAGAYAFLLPLASAVVLLDQLTKSLVRNNLDVGGVWVPWSWLAPYARIVHWHNTGAAFGLFKDFGLVFTGLAVLVALAILYYFPQVPRKEWSLRLAMGFQLGGAVGNLTDRLTVGQVTDFISVGSFPVFNIADASISIGVAVLIVGMWLTGREDKVETESELEMSPSSDANPGEMPRQGERRSMEASDQDENARLPGRESL